MWTKLTAVWMLLTGLCLCPFVRIEKQTLAKYLPAISGASVRHPAAHKGRVLCAFVHMCVQVLCLAKCLVARVFSGCFRARSANTACMLVCVHVWRLVCVHQLCGGS